jgi:hypothetical protein
VSRLLLFSPEDIGVVVTTIKTNKMQPYLGMGYDQFLRKKLISVLMQAYVRQASS